MTLTDAIEKAKSSDRVAIGMLYDASYDRVYRMIFHRTLDTAFTEDVISTVYMKMMRSITKFRGKSEGEFFSWILSIAYTTLIDALRHEDPITSLDDIEWEPGFEKDHTDIDRNDKITEILEYMKNFSERDRMIVTLRIWDDLSYDEIADITGESVVNAKKIVSRSLSKIAANISPLAFTLFLTLHVWTR